ncbi:MAG TPA: response regulator transcription factor [Ramlibacter sp.]|nr:response regulator transcription factor [Ramlibacter sp.]
MSHFVPDFATSTTRVLAADSDSETGEMLRDYLARFGMQVDVVRSGAGLRTSLAPGRFDVLLLEMQLPDEDGLGLCQWARRLQPDLPIIMLARPVDPASCVLGLEIGADDFLAKPFEPRELVARIKAVRRRGAIRASAESMLRFGNWTFDRIRRMLQDINGKVEVLSTSEARLLSAFVDHPFKVLSRDRLRELSCHPGIDVHGRAVDLAVSRLRGKLGDDAGDPGLIRTIRGAGYLFDTAVMR